MQRCLRIFVLFGKRWKYEKEILGMGTYFALFLLIAQALGIIHRGKIRVPSNLGKRYQNVKTSIGTSKAESQYLKHNRRNNFTNFAHVHSKYVHREKVLTFWLRNSVMLYYKESATACVLSKQLFLKISQNSQENTCGRASFFIKMTPAQETLL